MRTGNFFSFIVIALFISTSAAGDSTNDCVYNVYVETGSGIQAGTDSKISMTVTDPAGRSVFIGNLEKWGLMGPNHDYFERGNLDIFSGRGTCIGAPICRLNLTSDGSGNHHGWYCDYVEVASTGPYSDHCHKSIFYVDQWLATDAPPFELTAIVDGCSEIDGEAKQGKRRSGIFVAGRGKVKGSVSE